MQPASSTATQQQFVDTLLASCGDSVGIAAVDLSEMTFDQAADTISTLEAVVQDVVGTVIGKQVAAWVHDGTLSEEVQQFIAVAADGGFPLTDVTPHLLNQLKAIGIDGDYAIKAPVQEDDRD